MATEEATNPVADDAARADQTGVADQANAQSDDIDTEAFDREEADDEEANDETPSDEGESPDGLEDVEFDGKSYKLPSELKGALLRQSDYTKKTQELASSRKALEDQVRADIERQTAESRTALPQEYRQVAVLDQTIASIKHQFETPDQNGVALNAIDWLTFRAQVHANPEMKPVYDDYRARYEAAKQTLDDLNGSLASAKKDLETKESERLTTQREQATQALAKRQEETGKILAQEIKGWSRETAEKIIQFGMDNFGLTQDEVPEMTDPRVWKMLHWAMSREEENSRFKTSLKQHQTAANNQKAQESKPAERTKGTAQSNRVADTLGTNEWMRRREAQLARKRG